jgi:hypothetical protein
MTWRRSVLLATLAFGLALAVLPAPDASAIERCYVGPGCGWRFCAYCEFGLCNELSLYDDWCGCASILGRCYAQGRCFQTECSQVDGKPCPGNRNAIHPYAPKPERIFSAGMLRTIPSGSKTVLKMASGPNS